MGEPRPTTFLTDGKPTLNYTCFICLRWRDWGLSWPQSRDGLAVCRSARDAGSQTERRVADIDSTTSPLLAFGKYEEWRAQRRYRHAGADWSVVVRLQRFREVTRACFRKLTQTIKESIGRFIAVVFRRTSVSVRPVERRDFTYTKH